eukprot:gene1307-1447_t
MKRHAFKKREKKTKLQSPLVKKTRGPFKDKIDFDPRVTEDQVELSHDELKTVKRKLKEFGSVAAMFIDSEDDTDSEIEIDLDDMEKQSKPLKPILIENVEKFLKEGGKEQDNFERQLAFDGDQIKKVELETRGQGEKLATRLLKGDSLEKYKSLPSQILYGRENEHEARNEYMNFMSRTHQNFEGRLSGLVICKENRFIAASPDGIRSCKCCGEATIEYKCSFKNKDRHPRDAFLDKSIGGILKADGTYTMDVRHKYYYQIQGAMAASNIQMCDFVVYTTNRDLGYDGAIFLVEIPFDEHFWLDVKQKVRSFYLNWMLPQIFSEQSKKLNIRYEYQEHKSPDATIKILEHENLIECNSSQVTPVLCNIRDVPIFQEDIDSLDSGGWITDNIVTMSTRIICEKFAHLSSNVQIVATIFYMSLTRTWGNLTTVQNYEKAASFIKELSADGILIVPICEHNHWYLIVSSKTCAIVMDSLSHCSGGVISRDTQITNIFNFIEWKFMLQWKDVKQQVLLVPQQRNGSDCGMHTILNMYHFLSPAIFELFRLDINQLWTGDHRHWYSESTVRQERDLLNQFIYKSMG